jgi:uncharacterized protein (UPF0333 family)
VPDFSSYIGWAIVIAITIVGWIITSNNNKRVAKKAEDAAKQIATTELTKVDDIVKRLPCVKNNGDYMKEAGRLAQKVDDMEKQLTILLKQKLEN